MRNHFIPRFLLRAWSEGATDGKFQEFRLDLEGLPSFRRVSKATAYQEDLYALTRPTVAGMTKHAVETQVLRHIDNDAARVRAKMIRQGFKNLSHAERCDWVRFLMCLRIRQPDIIAQLRTDSAEHLHKTLADQPEEYEASAVDDDPTTLVEWVEQTFPGLIENFGLSFVHELIDNEENGRKIISLRRVLWDFTGSKHELLLADNPCIFTGALDAPELVVALPISPTKAFLAVGGDRTAARLRRTDSNVLAMWMNESSVSQARARVYARNAKPKRFIENRLRSRS